MRRRTRRTVPATVSPSAMRRLSVADACEGSTFAAVPPCCMVAATVVRTSAAGSPPIAAKTRAVSRGERGERAQQLSGRGRGPCSAKRLSIRVIAGGVRAGNVPGVEPVDRARDAPRPR